MLQRGGVICGVKSRPGTGRCGFPTTECSTRSAISHGANVSWEVDDWSVGVTVCEDIWKENGPGEVATRHGGASVMLNLSMSPYHRGKGEERAAMLQKRAVDAGAYVCM